MSIFRFEYQTDLNIEECEHRLTEAYFEKSRSEGVRYYVDDRPLWGLGFGRTRQGAVKLEAGTARGVFVFLLSLDEYQGKTRILCRHNPFRPFAWGKFLLLLIGIPAMFLYYAITSSLPLSETFFSSLSTALTEGFLPSLVISPIAFSPFIAIAIAQEASARKIVIKYLEKALEADPCIPPKKRRHIFPEQFRP
jgi:hypothetical protein